MGLTPEQDQNLSQLMILAQTGEKEAYDRLLKTVYSLLKGYVDRRLGLGADSEDVLQAILISVHQARHTYNVQKPFAPWLYAIAKHRVCDHWRKVSRRLEVELEEPDPMVRNDSLADRLTDYLKRLPERQQHVVDLLKMKGFSIRETAKKLNMTEASVKVTAHRAYEALRKEFEREQDEYA